MRQKESFPLIIQSSLLKEKNYHGAGRMIVARSHAAIPGDHKYQIDIFVCSNLYQTILLSTKLLYLLAHNFYQTILRSIERYHTGVHKIEQKRINFQFMIYY